MTEIDEIPKDPVDDPANYRLGIFYYCKSDKRLMPPKRIKGSGWEINYAHRYSIFLLLGIIASGMIIALGCILVANWLM